MVIGGYFVYSASKTLIHDNPESLAFANARQILNLESQIGFMFESSLQQWFLNNAEFIVHMLNWFYTLGY